MCGIAGWATFSRNFHASRRELEAMAANLPGAALRFLTAVKSITLKNYAGN
ncbi:hypothetical protein [Brenneria uluponensis]|uniref:hypothetical protein n=1 Tax=Brenneria uluponensis TaxID=3057057 RepID=UPI003CCC7F44